MIQVTYPAFTFENDGIRIQLAGGYNTKLAESEHIPSRLLNVTGPTSGGILLLELPAGGTGTFLNGSKIRAPNLFFWARTEAHFAAGDTQVSPWIGPFNIRSTVAETGPQVYFPNPQSPLTNLQVIPTGTPVGGSLLKADANIPGQFSYTPVAGTPLTPIIDHVRVRFTPSVSGFTAFNWTYPVRVASDTVASRLIIDEAPILARNWRYLSWFGYFYTETSPSQWIFH
ncbi:MAG: hypothetical protein ACFE0O_12310 [Opitutales bacterium]